MLKTGSFSEVLEDLTKETSEWTIPPVSEWESHLDPRGISQIMAELSGISAFPQTRTSAGLKAFRVRPQSARPRPPHSLSALQQDAFTLLKSYTLQLDAGFNLRELKSAYRAALLQTHPDQGGSSESFFQVQQSYQILLALFNKVR